VSPFLAFLACFLPSRSLPQNCLTLPRTRDINRQLEQPNNATRSYPERRRDRPCEASTTWRKSPRCQFRQNELEDERLFSVYPCLFQPEEAFLILDRGLSSAQGR
jgi:hypothetical protein